MNGNETCDDNNVFPNDGCSVQGQIETGFNCVSQPSVCSPFCGDGLIKA